MTDFRHHPQGIVVRAAAPEAPRLLAIYAMCGRRPSR